MSYPITSNAVADLLDALGKTEAAANVRWSERDPERRHLDELEALRAEVEELREEVKHSADEADRAWKSMCSRCKAKQDAS